MEKFPKFIIEDGSLILSKCTFHRELAIDPSKVKGGGWFSYRNNDKSFTLNGSSVDFGQASIEDIIIAIKNDKVYTKSSRTHSIAKNFKFFYDSGSEITPLN